MRYFLLLLQQSRILILFLALEGLAIYWIASVQSYPRSKFSAQTTEINGRVSQWQSELKAYVNLKVENQQLAEENLRMRQQLNSSLMVQYYGADTINDSVLNQRYTYLSAEIVRSSHLKRANFIIIDKGSRSGVKRDMGVMGPNGVVGVVAGVSANFSRVIPIINSSLTISGALKNEGYFGPVKWPGRDYQHSQLNDIPRYSDVKEGDTVLTDGRSQYFPAGIVIGTVEDKQLQADQNFYELGLNLSTDFASLRQVYVIKDFFGAELDSLQNESLP
ncbi:MAG: rod shape-determining protein MreC [Bacteroidetes bacterium]|nr:rod shape-determining protein MreC [Bacteroidota bacterium]